MSNGIILLAGPTASGKSALALDLAERLESAGGVTIINADSMQLYRELAIVTARPGRDEEARAPHRLFGVLSAAESCSVALWRAMAVEEIETARRAGRIPLLVGGTGLYFHALTRGISPVPDIPADVRTEARALHRRLGAEAFHDRLALRDAEMAARLHPGDSQRVIRAWEVLEASGHSLAEWQRRPPDEAPIAGPIAVLKLVPPREWLYRRCDERFLSMIEQGAIAEVEAFDRLGLASDRPATKALGVPEIRRYLRGQCSLEEAVDAACTATRRYAKRQLTWFRHQMRDAAVIAETDSREKLDLSRRIIERRFT